MSIALDIIVVLLEIILDLLFTPEAAGVIAAALLAGFFAKKIYVKEKRDERLEKRYLEGTFEAAARDLDNAITLTRGNSGSFSTHVRELLTAVRDSSNKGDLHARLKLIDRDTRYQSVTSLTTNNDRLLAVLTRAISYHKAIQHVQVKMHIFNNTFLPEVLHSHKIWMNGIPDGNFDFDAYKTLIVKGVMELVLRDRYQQILIFQGDHVLNHLSELILRFDRGNLDIDELIKLAPNSAGIISDDESDDDVFLKDFRKYCAGLVADYEKVKEKDLEQQIASQANVDKLYKQFIKGDKWNDELNAIVNESFQELNGFRLPNK